MAEAKCLGMGSGCDQIRTLGTFEIVADEVQEI
jgi:hypothetical protein